MSREDECRRLKKGPDLHEVPSPLGLSTLVATSNARSYEILARVQEVLNLVLDEIANDWEDVDGWSARLPHWFVDACAPESSREEAEQYLAEWRLMTAEQKSELARTQRWSLGEWLAWMQPSERYWEYWNCYVKDKNTFIMEVKPSDRPYPHGAVDWLLRAAGACRVDESDENL